jgi:hypothetical protein
MRRKPSAYGRPARDHRQADEVGDDVVAADARP